MKVAPETQLRLLELAELDAEHLRLQHVANNMPEQQHLVEIEDDRRAKRLAAADARGNLDVAETELQRTRDDVRVVVERRELDQSRLATATSTKDVAALQAELETLQRRADNLAAIELEQEETLAQARAEFERAHGEMTEIEELATDLLRRRKHARDHIRAEAKRLHERRQALVQQLPAALLDVYERARKNAGVGAAELVGTVSSASNLEIGQTDLNRIRAMAPDEIAFCPVTGAVLVRTARSDLQ